MVAQETRQRVSRVNDRLTGSYKLAVVSMDDLELLEKNARYMKAETFRNLVENIRRDGGLSSVPFCWYRDGVYRVLSGNHRVMAAKEAGLTEIPVLYTDADLTREDQVAIQLSHNAVVGEDDPVVLKELYDEIDQVALKYYAGLDDALLKQLESITLPALSEARLDYRTVTFMFLPEEVERLQEAFKAAMETDVAKEVFAGRFQEYDRLMDASQKVRASYKVWNAAVAFMLVLDVFERHQTDLCDGWLDEEGELKHKEWVPLAGVFGTDRVPAEAARVIKQAVERMVSREEVTKKSLWRAVELWAADYLAGA